MKHGNVFGSDSKAYNASIMPLWLEVKERKIGGGTIDISGLEKGAHIPAAVPVYLPKMGGNAVILDAFEVDGAITTSSTSVKLKDGVYGTKPVEGIIVGKVSANGTASKAAALGAYAEGTGFAINAGDLGALNNGDKLYVISAAGSSKAALLPNGLTWRDIYVDTDAPTVATVAVVTKGQVLGDRCPEIPAMYKDALVGITFEYEL